MEELTEKLDEDWKSLVHAGNISAMQKKSKQEETLALLQRNLNKSADNAQGVTKERNEKVSRPLFSCLSHTPHCY